MTRTGFSRDKPVIGTDSPRAMLNDKPPTMNRAVLVSEENIDPVDHQEGDQDENKNAVSSREAHS